MPSFFWINQRAKRLAPGLYRHYVNHQRTILKNKVKTILSDPRNPITLTEKEFNSLQTQYEQWWPQYDFDAYSTGRRAYERALSFLNVEPLRKPGRDILEIACGDGMSGTVLSAYGHNITLLDYQDWRDSRAQKQRFIQADLAKPIPLPSSSYDFIFSFNAFEHIPDPTLTLSEILRLLRPGGFVWIDFNPLYASPLGLHAFCFRMPYPQFLFSDSVIQLKLRTLGLNDLGREMTTLQPLNQWRPQQFRDLWRRSDCRIVEYCENSDFRHLDLVLKYPDAFRGRHLSLDDLTVSGMRVVLQKHETPCTP